MSWWTNHGTRVNGTLGSHVCMIPDFWHCWQTDRGEKTPNGSISYLLSGALSWRRLLLYHSKLCAKSWIYSQVPSMFKPFKHLFGYTLILGHSAVPFTTAVHLALISDGKLNPLGMFWKNIRDVENQSHSFCIMQSWGLPGQFQHRVLGLDLVSILADPDPLSKNHGETPCSQLDQCIRSA